VITNAGDNAQPTGAVLLDVSNNVTHVLMGNLWVPTNKIPTLY
jgi:hypothetical protein